MKQQKVKELLGEIKENLTQTSSSAKDEEKVMRAMLNDKEYVVGIYGKEGKVGEYCPYEDARSMITTVIASTTKMSQEEARKLAEEHQFKKSEAQAMVNISKEFVNTYLQTGRKLPLGGREKSDVALSLKQVDETVRTYPRKIGVDENDNGIFERATTKVKAHESVRVHASCPDWIK